MRDEQSSTHQLADAIPHIVWTHDDSGTVTYVNRKWAEFTGSDLEESLRLGMAQFVHPDDHATLGRIFAESQTRDDAFEATYRLRARDDVFALHHARIVPLQREGSRVVAWVGTATNIEHQHRQDSERQFLADAGRVLGRSLDARETLADVARLVVPNIADWCALDLVDADGQIERATVAHVDPTKVELAHRIPPQRDAPSGAAAVIRTRLTELIAEVTDEVIDAAIPDLELRALVRKLGLRSSICVPLLGRSEVLGALTLVSAESRRRYTAHDVAFAEDFAGRITMALENARLYAAATDARAAAEAIAADVREQSTAVTAALLAMRAERDAAVTRASDRGNSDG